MSILNIKEGVEAHLPVCLHTIVEKKKARLDTQKMRTPISELKSRITEVPQRRDFAASIERKRATNIKFICELKKASPSKGLIRPDFNVKQIASIYSKKAVDAVSVLTEEDFFQGHLDYIKIVKECGRFPVLRKDFIFDEYQLYESCIYGADALLLIASLLSISHADHLLGCAKELGLDVLFEVHDFKELEMALLLDVPIIGINNRNLKTLDIDLNTTFSMLKDIPEGKIVVSESGISNRDAVCSMEASSAIHALLIGTSIMKASDIEGKLDELKRKDKDGSPE
ncbi:MAG: indole-3-glycerol phosphate synthase TrpC [Candidatus Magnetoovum sp. WYHC-5]|nr:indole-3-glycerol phosphate synthase TrpC [Candidatus Magnetoovum sp. WYHC-5]